MWWSWGSARVSCAFLARPRSAQVTPLVLRSARDGRWRVQQGVAADCPAAPTGDWVGVQLDKPSGTHDGGAHGQRYFTCAFSRPSSACVAARNHPLRDRRIPSEIIHCATDVYWAREILNACARPSCGLCVAPVFVHRPAQLRTVCAEARGAARAFLGRSSEPDPELAARAARAAGGRLQACLSHLASNGDARRKRPFESNCADQPRRANAVSIPPWF